MRILISLFLLAAWPSLAQDIATARPFAAFDLASAPVLNDPHDLAIGPDGRLYVADKFGDRIAVMDPETLELVETIDLPLPNIHDISFSPDGLAYVAVTGLNLVIALDLSTTPPLPVLSLPAARTEGVLAHSNGRIYVMESGTGMITMVVDDNMLGRNSFHGAHDVAEAPDGSIWIADNFNRRLVRLSADLTPQQVLDAPRFGFAGPRYLDVMPSGILIVADQDAHRILMIDPDGPDGGTLLGVLGDGTPGIGPGKFDDPEGVAVDGDRFFFADSDNNRIVRYSVVMN